MELQASFKELFCEYYGYRQREYEARALFRLIHREARLLAVLIWKIHPDFFKVDLQILQDLGAETSRQQILQAARRIEQDYRDKNSFGWFRQIFQLWISPEQVTYTAMRLCPMSTGRIMASSQERAFAS